LVADVYVGLVYVAAIDEPAVADENGLHSLSVLICAKVRYRADSLYILLYSATLFMVTKQRRVLHPDVKTNPVQIKIKNIHFFYTDKI
jgi:hypothetical protein